MIFSVVVPFLNEEKLIECCLNSLLQQEFEKQEYELIFVDNGSTDRSVDIVQAHPVTLLSEPRKDPYLARNRGIQAARGQFLAFTDSDCIADPRWLANLHRSFTSSNADIVIGRLLYPAPTPLSLECHEQYYHMKLNDIYSRKQSRYYYGHAGNMAIKASVFEQVGLFPQMPIVGDTAIIHNLLQQKPHAHILYDPRARVVHAEVRRFRHYLYKQYESGQYSETYSKLSTYRALRVKDNIRIARLCMATFRYKLWKKLLFGSTLVTGFLFYTAGRLRQRFQASRAALTENYPNSVRAERSTYHSGISS